MCLESLDKPTKRRRYGYKVLKLEDGKYYSPIVHTESIPTNKWIREKPYRENNSPTQLWGRSKCIYPIGFHCLATKQGAIKFQKAFGIHRAVIVKVEMRNIVASGQQEGYTKGMQCYVAKEIRIIEEITRYT